MNTMKRIAARFAVGLLGLGVVVSGCSSEVEESNPEGTGGEGTGGEGTGGEGTGGEGTGGDARFPTGEVNLCLGSACPYEECDNELFFSDLPCSTVYPEPLDESSELCPDGLSGGYCLAAGDQQWAINCDTGVASTELCAIGGCTAVITAGCARLSGD
jgi:hypothetical protein